MLAVLVQLTRLEDEVLEKAASVLEKCLGIEALVDLEVVQPPMVLYDWSRMQYRSDYLLGWLEGLREGLPGDLLVALGDIDAYVPGLNFVFGQASPQARVASIYLRRLRPEYYGARDNGLLLERIEKEVLHEVGHLLGLEHCGDKRCVMSFSNSVQDVDHKRPAFCRRCASRLKAAGLKPGCILE